MCVCERCVPARFGGQVRRWPALREGLGLKPTLPTLCTPGCCRRRTTKSDVCLFKPNVETCDHWAHFSLVTLVVLKPQLTAHPSLFWLQPCRTWRRATTGGSSAPTRTQPAPSPCSALAMPPTVRGELLEKGSCLLSGLCWRAAVQLYNCSCMAFRQSCARLHTPERTKWPSMAFDGPKLSIC